MSVATILVLYAIGVGIPALTPVPAFATNDNNDANTDDNTNYNNDANTDDKTDDKNNHYNILLFLIDIVECFTTNGEEFSDDVQLCLYDVIDEYFDNIDNNNLNNDNDGQDNNNDNDIISSNDNDNNNNNGASSQET
jgi:hypothetical protein